MRAWDHPPTRQAAADGRRRRRLQEITPGCSVSHHSPRQRISEFQNFNISDLLTIANLGGTPEGCAIVKFCSSAIVRAIDPRFP
jgi:hypothetical protein